MSAAPNPCTIPIVATVTVLPQGDPACDDCSIEILSVAYAACGDLVVEVTPDSGELEISLDGADYITFSTSSHTFQNVPIGAHQVVVRKAGCTDLWSGSVYCSARRCFRPGSYECVLTDQGVPSGYVNITTLIEYDCLTEQATGRSFDNNGTVSPLIVPEMDTTRCPDGRCIEYAVTVDSATAQSELVWTDCDSDLQIYRGNVSAGETPIICSKTVPKIIKNGSISVLNSGPCQPDEGEVENCCDFLVTAFGVRGDLIFSNIQYTDCNTGQLEYAQIRQGTSMAIRSKTEPVLISDKGGSVETVGNCEPIVVPGANKPTLNYSVAQPYCSGATLSSATISLTNINNATRYKICNASTFNCLGICTQSDGTIDSTQKNIVIPTVNNLLPDNVTIRIYNGDGCEDYLDIFVKLYNQDCASPEITHISFDMIVPQWSQSLCEQPTTYQTTYNMYAKLVATGVTQSGQTAVVGGGAARTIPAGVATPDAYLMAAIKPSCGSPANPGSTMNVIFYRFAANLNKLYADHPGLEELSIEMWGERTKSGGPTPDIITAASNVFAGVRTIYNLLSNGSIDFSRDPLYPGSNNQSDVITYDGNTAGFRKLCTYVFNKANQTLTYVP